MAKKQPAGNRVRYAAEPSWTTSSSYNGPKQYGWWAKDYGPGGAVPPPGAQPCATLEEAQALARRLREANTPHPGKDD